MEWNTKIVVQIVGASLLMATVLIVAVLRLSGLTTWPGRTLAVVGLALLIAPIALLLLSVAKETEMKSESRWSSLWNFFPPWW
jgi:multisubunit Na+/H+ antiporter MnhG subunit